MGPAVHTPSRPAGPTPAGRSVPDALESPFCFAFGVASGDRLALVVLPLAPSDRDLDLGPAVLEVQPQRHERHALLVGCSRELVDLAVMQEELARSYGIELVTCVRVRRDVHAV